MPALVVACILAEIIGCQHDVDPPPYVPPVPVSVGITPQSATLNAGNVISLLANIKGWKVDSTLKWSLSGNNPQTGSLSVSGNSASYTAPSNFGSNPISVTVLVRSNEDTSKSASCIFTVNPGAQNPIHTRISLNLSQVTIQPGETIQLQDSISPANTPVKWELVSGPGTVSASGLYTAPTAVDSAIENAVVKVFAVTDSTVWATAKIAVAVPAPCFRTVVWPILISHCTVGGCHNAIDRVHGLDFTSYDSVMNTVIPYDTTNSLLHQRLNHFATSPDSQVRAINMWIFTGAKYSLCPPDAADFDTTNVHYSTFIAPTIATYCLGCHSERFASECQDIDFSTYNEVALMAQNGQLMSAVSGDGVYPRMPQWGLPLDSSIVLKFRAWINRGYPND